MSDHEGIVCVCVCVRGCACACVCNNTLTHLCQVGDRVAAMLPLLGSQWGALAEFAAVNEEFVAKVMRVYLAAREHGRLA